MKARSELNRGLNNIKVRSFVRNWRAISLFRFSTQRCLDLAAHLISRDEAPASIERGGRKAHAMRS
jgi:hypothetical protein